MRYVRTFAAIIVVLAGMSFARADDVQVGKLVLSKAWSRATPKGASTGAAYLTITNKGDTADRLVSISSALSAKAEVHEMSMNDGVMRMRPVPDGVIIKPGETVTLQPNGYHIMLVGLKAPLKQGDKVVATLVFEKAGSATLEFDVRPVGATDAGAGDRGGKMSPMPGMGR